VHNPYAKKPGFSGFFDEIRGEKDNVQKVCGCILILGERCVKMGYKKQRQVANEENARAVETRVDGKECEDHREIVGLERG
jgi:hypothetical protein